MEIQRIHPHQRIILGYDVARGVGNNPMLLSSSVRGKVKKGDDV